MSAPPTADRPRWQTVQALGCAAVIGWTIAYVLCDWGGWHRLTYDQYRGAWSWNTGPTPRIPINYMGIILWGIGGAAVAVVLTLVGLRLWRRPLPSSVLDLGTAWAFTGVGLAGTYYTWSLWPF